MVRPAFFRPTRSAIPVMGGAAALLLVAGVLVALPVGVGQGVEAIGLAGLQPLDARTSLLLALGAGVVAGAVVWAALFLLFGRGGPFHRAPVRDEMPPPPAVRRADAHPDAPPRHPLTAAELGTPPPSSPVEQGLPTDLDQPLAAFDPAAIPEVPREPMRPVASVVPPASGVPGPAPLPRNDEPSPSIAALLERLERGTRRRGRG